MFPTYFIVLRVEGRGHLACFFLVETTQGPEGYRGMNLVQMALKLQDDNTRVRRGTRKALLRAFVGIKEVYQSSSNSGKIS